MSRYQASALICLVLALHCGEFISGAFAQTPATMKDSDLLSQLKQIIGPASDLNQLFCEASNAIERSVLSGDFASAHELYEAKLQIAARAYGAASGAVLDALHDGIFIASQQNDQVEARVLLQEYARVTAQLRLMHREEEIKLAEMSRKIRLQAKLDEDLARVFQPLNL